jgi:hypothetical protein
MGAKAVAVDDSATKTSSRSATVEDTMIAILSLWMDGLAVILPCVGWIDDDFDSGRGRLRERNQWIPGEDAPQRRMELNHKTATEPGIVAE